MANRSGRPRTGRNHDFEEMLSRCWRAEAGAGRGLDASRSNAVAWSPLIGFPKYQPWPTAQPKPATAAWVAASSMPSTVTGTRNASASVVTARTIAALSGSLVSVETKLRSILITSNGKRRR